VATLKGKNGTRGERRGSQMWIPSDACIICANRQDFFDRKKAHESWSVLV
jgi:hypothetical protein